MGLAGICDLQEASTDADPALYYLPDDPQQERNLISEQQDLAKRMHVQYVEFLETLGTEEKYLRYRRRLFG